jgi:hypothetical protein
MVSERSVYVRVKGDVSDYVRELMKGAAATRAFVNELDTSTDRSTMLTQSLLAIGPALVPIAAAGVPALAGMTNQLAFVAAGVGVAALAFHGLGDALKATNEYAIDPTDANLQKMRETMAALGPAGREFVTFLQDVRPQLQDLQDTAQAGLFPGAQDGIEDLMTRAPQVQRIISEVAKAGGDLLAEAGDNLADPRWNDFFDFLEAEARPTLMDFGRSLGNLAEGFANLWMAFDPLSDKFSDSFLQMSRDFSEWTDGLEDTDGFKDFLAYIERTGPQVWETLGALGNALLQVVEAAAPVGEVALPVIEAVADVLATVADSDAGPILIGAAAGISAISRAVGLYNAANGSALSGLLSGSVFGGGRTAFKEAATATTELKVAQDRLAASAKSAQAAQFALIPTADKRRAIADYTTQSKAMAEAEKQAGAATRSRNAQMAQLAGGAGLLAFSMSDLDEKMGLTNTSTLAMMGSLVGPWGAAVGAGVGLVMDLSSANDEAAESAKRFQAAFADASSLQEQEAVIDALRQRIEAYSKLSDIEPLRGKVKDDVETLQSALSSMTAEHDKASSAAQDLRFNEAGLGDAMAGTNEVVRNSTDVLLALIDARNAAADQALTARDAERAYEAAIDDAADSIKKNGQTLDDTTPKGRANAEALDGIASAWNNLDSAGRAAKGGLGAARKEFISAATSAGMTKEAARQLANQLLNIDPPPPIEIKMKGADAAKTAADALRNALDSINPFKDIYIRTHRSGDDVGNAARAPRGFTGMRIPDGYADGGKPEFSGRVPGTPPADPTEDNVFAVTTLGNPLRVRSREWIINEKQSDKNDPWLRAINNGLVLDDIFSRAAIPGFASGGRYDDFSALTQSSRLDIERQKLRIKDIQDSLNEQETVGKGKNKHKRPKLRGREKTVAELELKEAKAELEKMYRENRELKKYGSKDYEENLRDQSEKDEREREKAEDEAAQRIADAATLYTSTKKTAADRFNIMTGGSAAAVDRTLERTLANSEEFLGLLGTLKGKGASPWLLDQFVAAGPTGGAIRLARQYATDQAAFDRIQVRASQVDQYTSRYAGLVGSANFMNPAAWNSGISMQPTQAAPITASLVGAEVSVGQDGLMRFVQGQIVVSQGGYETEARFTP